MTDLQLAATWIAVLGGGLGVCVLLHRLGVARTHVRDLLHVGAGSWVIGWPFWHRSITPITITAVAALGVLALPVAAGRLPALGRISGAVSDEDERWSGIAIYTVSFAALTCVAFTTPLRFAAAAALLALSLGDGVGGAIGRRFGRHHFTVPGGKQKSLEGSLAVAVMAAVGVVVAAGRLDAAASPLLVCSAAVVAALVEAVAPRASDNALLPAAVFGWIAAWTAWPS